MRNFSLTQVTFETCVWDDILAWPVTPGDISINLTKDTFSFVNCEIAAQTFLCNLYTYGGRKRKIVGLELFKQSMFCTWVTSIKGGQINESNV